jgi:RND family efflux transporter MFP subunit
MAVVLRFALLGIALGLTAAADLPPRPVRVQTIALLPSERVATYSGTIQARVQADLAFRVGGKIVERPVDLGDRVREGQLLARLDPTDLRYALEAQSQAVASAEADAANARAEMQRYERLGRTSPAFMLSEYVRRQTALSGAEAKLAQASRQEALARNQLAYGELRADADGLVTALPMQVGQVVQAGQAVATLAHSREIEAAVDVPENRLPEVRAADAVTVTLWSAPDRPIRGRVREIGALADSASRTFAVKITLIDAPAQDIGLGMTAAVRFVRHAGPPAALLPASALTDRDGTPAVWVLDSKAARASLRPVTLAGASDDGMVSVTGGLRAGEQVVTAGVEQMRADLPVSAWAGAAY